MKQFFKGFFTKATYFLSGICIMTAIAMIYRDMIDTAYTADPVLIGELFTAAISLIGVGDFHQRSQLKISGLIEKAKDAVKSVEQKFTGPANPNP